MKQNLRDIVAVLDTLNPEHTIYAEEPWTADSQALVAEEPALGGLPQQALEQRLAYFLEVFIAQDFMAGWEANQIKPPTITERCDRLILYAADDA